MKQQIILLFWFCTVPCYFACAQKKEIKYVMGSINREAILSDIDAYAARITKNHIRPFNSIKKTDFYEKMEQIKRSANEYNIDELFIKWLQLNASIGDEHTQIHYGQNFKDIFPFCCVWFNEGIFITSTRDKDLTYLYSKIIAVNNIPVNEVVDRIKTVIPDPSGAVVKATLSRFIFDPFILHGLKITDTRSSAEYTVVTLKNDTVKFVATPVDKRGLDLLKGFDRHSFLRTSEDSAYWFKYVDSSKYLYLKYNTCYSQKNNPFEKFIKKVMKEIDKEEPDKIIVDLRDNSGGYQYLLLSFIEYLKLSPLNKKGKIYVLVGRATFSAAVMNTIDFKNNTYATVVGEETGGTVGFYAGVEYYTLPATKIMIGYSTVYVETNERYTGSLKPDVVIIEKFSDYSHGIDAVLDYAITH